MTRHLVVLAVAFALSACSGKDAAPQGSASTPAGATQTAAADDQAPAGFAYSPFPQGVVLVQPFHVRSDRIYTTKPGAQRRRATLELLADGPATATDSVRTQMAASGFRALTVKDKGDGVTRLAFIKKGMGRINVSTSSEVGDKPSNPHALGLIVFDWQLAPAPASAPVAASPEQPVDQAATGG